MSGGRAIRADEASLSLAIQCTLPIVLLRRTCRNRGRRHYYHYHYHYNNQFVF